MHPWFNYGILAMAVLLLWAKGCRKDHGDDANLDATATIWYDSLGNPGDCESAATSCEHKIDPQKFIERCVEEGHRAKTCGCTVRCSGPVVFGDLRIASPKEPSKNSNFNDPCSPASLETLESILPTLKNVGGSRDCVERFVCKGFYYSCTEASFNQGGRLKELLRANQCTKEIVTELCDADYVESHKCPTAIVKNLSQTWFEHVYQNSHDKACLQNFLCASTAKHCNEDQHILAKSIRDMFARHGCTYWYGYFCRLGALTL